MSKQTVVKVPVEPNRYRDGFSGTASLMVNHRRYGIGGWDEERAAVMAWGHRGQHSAKIAGPVAYAFAEAVVITAWERPVEPYVEANMGDVVEVNGHTYKIAPCANDNIELLPVDMPQYDERPVIA